jgi:hypothetical protein
MNSSIFTHKREYQTIFQQYIFFYQKMFLNTVAFSRLIHVAYSFDQTDIFFKQRLEKLLKITKEK